MKRSLRTHIVFSCLLAGLLVVTIPARSQGVSVRLISSSALAAALGAGSSGQCNPVRTAVRTGTELNAAAVDMVHPFSGRMDNFIRNGRPAYLPDDFRLTLERALFSLQYVYVLSFKMTRYGDLELLVGDTPTIADAATIIAVNPSPQCIPQGSPFYAPSKTVRDYLLTQLGRGRSSIPVGQWLAPPPPQYPQCWSTWQIQGLGYFSPRPLEPHSAPNGAEMLPITDAKYLTVCPEHVQAVPSIDVHLSSEHPSKSGAEIVYATVKQDNQPVGGAYLSARWHFKRGVVRCTAETDATGRAQCSESLQNAESGAPVRVDVYLYFDLDLPSQSYHRALTFVPGS